MGKEDDKIRRHGVNNKRVRRECRQNIKVSDQYEKSTLNIQRLNEDQITNIVSKRMKKRKTEKVMVIRK